MAISQLERQTKTDAKRVGAVAVVGGGIAGMQASLDLAESGFKVYVIESKSSIGGRMAQLDKTFPTNDCAMCIMAPKLVELGRHPNVELLTCSELKSVEGDEGNFKVRVLKKTRYVDETKCIGCGTCEEKCPMRVPDEHNEGLGQRRAIYIQFPQSVPRLAKIDEKHCLYFTKKTCGICKKLCPTDAIDFDQKEKEVEINVGSIILATGYNTFDPARLEQYRSQHPDVITSLQFERILSPSGPSIGQIYRPSDKKEPKKIAFLQCVGSRDIAGGNPYCSAVCCMYAIKEAIIAKEHIPDIECSIFMIDVRSYGKGFEEYYNRAREVGVKFVKSRAAVEVNGESLLVKYEDQETGRTSKEAFDLVVLSVGLEPSPEIKALSATTGVNLSDYGFVRTSVTNPVETSRPGIYVCGIAQSPKDIPDSVAQAGAAASKAGLLISSERGTLVEEKKYPPEKTLGEAQRIGVFVCHCGINIAGVIDVERVAEYAKTLPNVAYSTHVLYACSQDNLEIMKNKIEEENLRRVVVASCTPRTHEPLFRDNIREAGLNPYLFEFVNIREQCSWVHMHRKDEATQKAMDLVRSGVAKASILKPLYAEEIPLIKRTLVIGGGVAGMTVASDLGEKGVPVYLVEKEDQLGGRLKKVKRLPDGQNACEILEKLVKKVESNQNIMILKRSQVVEIEGVLGNFRGTIWTDGKNREVEVGAIVVATGAEFFKPEGYYHYGEDKSIVTQTELEEMLDAGEFKAKTVLMIQCVGARTEGREYCSRVCCVEALKNALKIKETSDANVFVLYRDIRTYGIWEELFRKCGEQGVTFVKYDPDRPPQVAEGRVVVYDLLLGDEIEIPSDLVVLSTPLVPPKESEKLARTLRVPLDKDGFFLEAHPKLRPVEFTSDGIFLCGDAHGPKLIDEAISQASAAASKAYAILSKDQYRTEAMIPEVNERICTACGTCESICPHEAIRLERRIVKKNPKLVAVVEKTKCRGCGACTASCPSSAIMVNHFGDRQVLAQVEALTCTYR